MLFDLIEDPSESVNLYGSPEVATVQVCVPMSTPLLYPTLSFLPHLGQPPGDRISIPEQDGDYA